MILEFPVIVVSISDVRAPFRGRKTFLLDFKVWRFILQVFHFSAAPDLWEKRYKRVKKKMSQLLEKVQVRRTHYILEM